MEEIRSAALAYYKTSSDEFKNIAHEFFKKLNHHSDGSVKISHLDEFFKERGYEPFHSSLLKELGKEPADYLEFTDAFVFYYVAVTRRPYCDFCQAFLKGLYFTCLNCFDHEDKTYNLCNNCFCKGKGCPNGHVHGAFLDNFTAFQAKSKAINNLKKNAKDLNIPTSRGGVELSPERRECHDLFQRMELSYCKSKVHGQLKTSVHGDGNTTICNIG